LHKPKTAGEQANSHLATPATKEAILSAPVVQLKLTNFELLAGLVCVPRNIALFTLNQTRREREEKKQQATVPCHRKPCDNSRK
jgi:hypothetical protein